MRSWTGHLANAKNAARPSDLIGPINGSALRNVGLARTIDVLACEVSKLPLSQLSEEAGPTRGVNLTSKRQSVTGCRCK